MNQIDDRALKIVLEGRDAAAGPELAEAIARARRDVSRIARGLELVATGVDERPTPRRRWALRAGIAAAIIGVSGLAGAVLLQDDEPARLATSPSSTVPGPALSQAIGPESLEERITQADRIVVGVVTAIDRGEVGGLPYVLATISVEETIKPRGDNRREVVGFDYDLGGNTSAAASASWAVGDRLLLFLVSDAGTVSEGLQPAHLQVAGGASGRYRIVSGRVDAPFTLDELRALVRT